MKESVEDVDTFINRLERGKGGGGRGVEGRGMEGRREGLLLFKFLNSYKKTNKLTCRYLLG